MTMLSQSTFDFSIRIAGAGLAVVLLSTPAQALTIGLDLTFGSDSYGPGPGVFGSSTSFWNHQSRSNSAADLALFDDT